MVCTTKVEETGMDISVIITELSKASPYALLLALGFYLFYKMHKNALSEIKDMSKTSIDEIRRAYLESRETQVK